jgi:hypothetical protein
MANTNQHSEALEACFKAWPHVNELWQDNEGVCYFNSELPKKLGKTVKMYKR